MKIIEVKDINKIIIIINIKDLIMAIILMLIKDINKEMISINKIYIFQEKDKIIVMMIIFLN